MSLKMSLNIIVSDFIDQGLAAMHLLILRDYSAYRLSQWEMTLQCNVISYWLNPCAECSMIFMCASWLRHVNIISSTQYFISSHIIEHPEPCCGFKSMLIWRVETKYQNCKLHQLLSYLGRQASCFDKPFEYFVLICSWHQTTSISQIVSEIIIEILINFHLQ